MEPGSRSDSCTARHPLDRRVLAWWQLLHCPFLSCLASPLTSPVTVWSRSWLAQPSQCSSRHPWRTPDSCFSSCCDRPLKSSTLRCYTILDQRSRAASSSATKVASSDLPSINRSGCVTFEGYWACSGRNLTSISSEVQERWNLTSAPSARPTAQAN